MSSLIDDLDDIKDVEDGLVGNKVANFAYEDSAYTNNQVNGVDDYNVSRAQNIPNANASILKVNATILAKGFRSQASSITRMLVNHFFGRVSYNLNKIHDNFSSFLTSLKSYIGQPNGIASLDENGRIPYSQLPESALEWKGEWDASTNTPHLEDGTGTSGDMYIVTVAGTQDLGSGDISFLVNDRVIYNGIVWQKFSGGDVRTVSEIPPDSNGNVDLALQTDITKILAPNIIAKLFGKDMAKNWKKVVHTNSIPLTDMIGSTAYGDDYLIYGDRGLYLLKSDLSECTQLVANVVTACTVIGTTVVIAVAYFNNANVEIYYSDDLGHWTKASISATGFTDVKKVNYLYTANGMCMMCCGFGASANNKYLYWSTDGKTWTASTSNFGSTANQEFYDISYNNGIWLTVVTIPMSSASSATKLYSSTDGKSWTSRATNNYGYGARRTGVRSILYKDGVWVWFGTTNTQTSTNGTSWTEKKIDSKSFYIAYSSNYHMEDCNMTVNGVYYFIGYINATGYGYNIIKTSDFQTFEAVYQFTIPTGVSNYWGYIPNVMFYLPDEEKFLVLGNKGWVDNSGVLTEAEGKIWTSTDGNSWVEETDLNTHIYNRVFANNKIGNLYILGRDGFLCTTEDTETWSKVKGKLKDVSIFSTFQFKGETVGGAFLFDTDYDQFASGIVDFENTIYFKWLFSGCTAFIGRKIDNNHWESLSTIAGRTFKGIKCVTDGNTVLLIAKREVDNQLGEDTRQPTNVLLKSTNLIDWEEIPLEDIATDTNRYNALYYSNVACINGKFYLALWQNASGTGAYAKTFVSTDSGATWQVVDSASCFRQISMFNGLYIGVFNTSGSSNGYLPKWSEDGITWTDCTATPSSASESSPCLTTRFAQFGNLLIGWAQESYSRLSWSENGKDWFGGEGINIGGGGIYWVKKVNNILFAGGFASQLYSSVDGKNWQASASFSLSTTPKDIFFGGGMYVLVANISQNIVAFWSEDGVNWTEGVVPTLLTNEKMTCVYYKNGVWVIGTTNRLFRSLDGKTFEETGTVFSGGSGYMNGYTNTIGYDSEWLTEGFGSKYSGIDEIE